MTTLIKMSLPDWEKPFASEAEARDELSRWICSGCKADLEKEEGAHALRDIGHLLGTPCGLEFTIEEGGP